MIFTENVECTKIDGVLIPNKLIRYAGEVLAPRGMHGAAIDYYIIFGRQKPETVMEMLEKYQNIMCTNFPIDNLPNIIGTNEGEKVVLEAIEKNLEGDIDLLIGKVSKRILFEIFKPWVHAYIDPAYVIYNIAFRRPQAYKIIISTEGGFEWVKRICIMVREKYEMTGPHMMEAWEMKALMPAAKVMTDGKK